LPTPRRSGSLRHEDVDLQARIRLRYRGEIIETTVGRTLLNEVVPEPLRFVNKS